jgi:hypothetical protein
VTTTFKDQGIKERQHLQEWICKSPSCLGEELLIIQKEFSGFDKTNERLDLLAIDKSGYLVLIENKLDDSGKDVVWQSLKYASYISTLTGDEIVKIYQDYLSENNDERDAGEIIDDFLGNDESGELVLNEGNTQRIILVAANFRKEVTSTVLWLMQYQLDISCIKVTPYLHNSELLVDFKKIIPLKEVEDYAIKVATKQKHEAIQKREANDKEKENMAFWSRFLKHAQNRLPHLSEVSPYKRHWQNTPADLPGVTFNVVVTKKYTRAEVYIRAGSQDLNNEIFDFLYQYKDELDRESKGTIVWERAEENSYCRIKIETDVISIKNSSEDQVIEKATEYLVEIHRLFTPLLKKYSSQ